MGKKKVKKKIQKHGVYCIRFNYRVGVNFFFFFFFERNIDS